MASTEDDYYRYIEYLQRQTLDEDWSPAFDSSKWKSWIVKSWARLEKMAQCTLGADGPSLVADLERPVHKFKPTTSFEMPTIKAIFEPVLAEVTKAPATIGINPVRSIEIVTSTDSCAFPASRPTTADHLLFVGLGTSSFCNYWSKRVTAVAMAMPRAIGFKRVDRALAAARPLPAMREQGS